MVAVANTVLAGLVYWFSLQHFWLDYVWCWPVLLALAFITATATATATTDTHGDPLECDETLWLKETGEGYFSSDVWQKLALQQGLLTPFIVFVRFAVEGGVGQPQRLGQWRWLFIDQLSSADWARLRRVCLNVRAGISVKPDSRVQ